MSNPDSSFDELRNVETWEVSTEGTVYVDIRDPRQPNGYKKQRVGGRGGGSRKLHITTDDRRFNQEQIVEEMAEHDPFTNGLLVLVKSESKDAVDDISARYHLSNADLAEILEIRDPDTFLEAVSDIKSELIIRRLFSLCEKSGTISQLDALRELVDQRYPQSGTQRSVREMIAAGEISREVVLSA